MNYFEPESCIIWIIAIIFNSIVSGYEPKLVLSSWRLDYSVITLAESTKNTFGRA